MNVLFESRHHTWKQKQKANANNMIYALQELCGREIAQGLVTRSSVNHYSKE